MVVFAAAAVAAKLVVVADSDVVVRGTSFAEAWWSCGFAVKIEKDGCRSARRDVKVITTDGSCHG